MAVAAVADTSTDEHAPRGAGARRPAPFVRWGLATHLVVTALVVGGIVWRLGGAFAYVLDDPAIHLSMADRLVHDATWGVTPGEFQSASSSPAWTTLLAGATLVAGPVVHVVPLALNVAAGVAVVLLLGRAPQVLRPARDRPADATATVVLVAVVLFLPGLAVVGMEHTLHVALALALVLGAHRWVVDPPGPPVAAVAGLAALATLVRFETTFVALGLAVGLLVAGGRAQTRRAVALAGASGAAVAGFAVANRAAGGGWLPNSVLAKGQATGASADGLGPVDVTLRLTHDRVLLALLLVAVLHLVLTGCRSRTALPAVALVVAAALHAALADVGWYERYQAYLVALGVYVLLGVLAEAPRHLRTRLLWAVAGLGLVLGAVKANLLVKAPLAADDMYRQQYHAALFLERYYEGEPVATDQLGYISWFHGGPITDFAGLGDREVLERDGEPRAELWADLARERGFRVVVLYDLAAGFDVPEDWILAGTWRIDGEPVTGVSDSIVFFATTPEEVEPLQRHLRAFEADMPARSHLELDENAELRALTLAPEEGDAAG